MLTFVRKYRTKYFMEITGKKNDQHNLWDKTRQGDTAAVERIYHEYSPQLYQYGLKFSKNTQIVEDCIQELFTRILANPKGLGKTDNLRIYLLGAYRNNLFRLLNKEKKYISEEVVEQDFEIHFSIEQKMIESEDEASKLTMLRKGLDNLSPRQKEAIYLRYTDGLEYTEIAEIMKMSIEASRNIIYRAIKSLRDEIRNSGIILLLFLRKDTL